MWFSPPGPSTLGTSDTLMVWDPPIFSKYAKLVKNDNMHLTKPLLFLRVVTMVTLTSQVCAIVVLLQCLYSFFLCRMLYALCSLCILVQ